MAYKLDYDVIIFGGGIAGSAVAYNLSLLQPGMRIAIIDPLDYGTLPYSVITYLSKTSNYPIEEAIGQTYTTQRFETVNNVGYSTELPDKTFGHLNYGKACEILQRKSGADIIRDAFSSLNEEKNFITLKSSKITLKSRFYIDAMGLFSPLRKQLGLSQPPVRVIVHYQTFEVEESVNGDINVDSFSYVVGNGVYNGVTSYGGWYYPLSKNKIEIGSAFMYTDPKGKVTNVSKKGKKLLKESLEEIVNSLFVNPKPADEQKTRFLACYPVKDVVHKNILFIGDVVGQGDPFLNANVHRYLDIAEYLALSVAEAYDSNDDSRIKLYQKAWNYDLINFSKRRMGRSEMLFTKKKEEWDRILAARKRIQTQKTIEHRTGKKNYSLKYTLQRYPIKDVITLLGKEIAFSIKYKLWRAKKIRFPGEKVLHLLRNRDIQATKAEKVVLSQLN